MVGITHTDGVIDKLPNIARLAVGLAFAKAGCQVVAPSDMMDGRIRAIKAKLLENGFGNRVPTMRSSPACSADRFAPQRVRSRWKVTASATSYHPGLEGWLTGQNLCDVAEDADILMVKPGYPFVRDTRKVAPDHPAAINQVGGEYATQLMASLGLNTRCWKVLKELSAQAPSFVSTINSFLRSLVPVRRVLRISRLKQHLGLSVKPKILINQPKADHEQVDYDRHGKLCDIRYGDRTASRTTEKRRVPDAEENGKLEHQSCVFSLQVFKPSHALTKVPQAAAII
ncbi:hypothetical protein BJ742DRAFT_779798 [Cladochytrium replicatum]|nr:hypothetical protein BJ742DRAFT_779798 [Cladochytrium replicatum]